MERFDLQPVLRSALPDVAAFLHRWRSNKQANAPDEHSLLESPAAIERRLVWLLTENPEAQGASTFGYSVRDESGAIRGVNLWFPSAFLAGGRRLLGLCAGTFFVEPPARSLGFYLFKKFLTTPGYDFYFASTCNASSSELWKRLGGFAVPHSETEYILPIRVDAMISAYVAYRTSSQLAARIARVCGKSANPILRLLTRPSPKLAVEPCEDWEKLSTLSRRHQAPNRVASDRSPEFLQWRHGAQAPSPSRVYLVRDERGNEGWFSLGRFIRGERGPCRASILLDAVWPRSQMDFGDIFQGILRVASTASDAVFFRWQSGVDYSEYSRCVIPRKLEAPLAFVSVPKGAPPFPLDSLDYDDSDSIAWAFQWRNG